MDLQGKECRLRLEIEFPERAYWYTKGDYEGMKFQDEVANQLNGELARAIADEIRVRGGGEYRVSASMQRNLTSDSMRFVIHAHAIDEVKTPCPYNWSALPRWAMYWTVSATGIVCLHEMEPVIFIHDGVWTSRGRLREDGFVEIPIGIDWRTLCFERPGIAAAKREMVAAEAHEKLMQERTNGRWGILRAIRKIW